MIIDGLDTAVAEQVSNVLDLSVLERLIEDTSLDFLPSLIEVFEAESSQRLTSIKSSLESNDLQTLGIEAHSLKGTSATFGAEKLRLVSEKVEKAAKMSDQAVVDENVPHIPELLDEVIVELNRFASAVTS